MTKKLSSTSCCSIHLEISRHSISRRQRHVRANEINILFFISTFSMDSYFFGELVHKVRLYAAIESHSPQKNSVCRRDKRIRSALPDEIVSTFDTHTVYFE